MKALLDNLRLNLDSVTETAIEQTATIKELKEELKKLKLANKELEEKVKYESKMKDAYEAEYRRYYFEFNKD